MTTSEAERLYAYTTLITRSSYLAGVLLLAHTLRKHGSKYPLVVLYTPNLPADAVKALQKESTYSNITVCCVEQLLPSNNQPSRLIAARFEDTWTKLRVFSEPLFGFSKVCYLDADMMIFNKNMDAVFDAANLSDEYLLAANHICCCNLDRDSWAPEYWTSENCAYTGLPHPKGLVNPTPVPKGDNGQETHKKLNGGMFVFRPGQELWYRMSQYFVRSNRLNDYLFPDQDFLADFFKDRWVSLGWQYNALKTMKYWHSDMWRDDEVVCLHYIVDKPWAARIGSDGQAGYKGRDGVTHQWWWDTYSKWEICRRGQGEEELLSIVKRNIAPPLGESSAEHSEDMKALGTHVQAFANNRRAA